MTQKEITVEQALAITIQLYKELKDENKNLLTQNEELKKLCESKLNPIELKMSEKVAVELTPEQWKIVEKCMAFTLHVEEDNWQFKNTRITFIDTRELSRVRGRVSYGYGGEGVTESSIRHKFPKVGLI